LYFPNACGSVHIEVSHLALYYEVKGFSASAKWQNRTVYYRLKSKGENVWWLQRADISNSSLCRDKIQSDAEDLILLSLRELQVTSTP